MKTFVTFKWKEPGYRSTFRAEHVNTLYRMIARNYKGPFEFVCISDNLNGLDRPIRGIPLWNTYSEVPSPHGRKFPSCYRRLKIFEKDAARWLGKRICMLDLDVVITGDITEIVERPEPFVAWTGTNIGGGYNCSLILMDAGARSQVWETFNPATSPRLTASKGYIGSDQGWISYVLGKGEATFTKKDGIYCYRLDVARAPYRALPPGARIVFWNGHVDPWSLEGRKINWVREHYK